jgi:hypothetical protein
MNSKFHYLVHKSPSLAPNLRHTDPVHSLSPYFFKIRFNIIFIFLSGLFSSGFPTQISYSLSHLPYDLHAQQISTYFIS